MVALMRMSPTDTDVWTFSPQLEVLFGNIYEVCPYWKNHATVAGFKDFKTPHISGTIPISCVGCDGKGPLSLDKPQQTFLSK